MGDGSHPWESDWGWHGGWLATKRDKGTGQEEAHPSWQAKAKSQFGMGMSVVMLCPVPFSPPSPPPLPRVIGTSETPIIIVGNKRDLQRGRVIPRWNVSNLVKKTWKCGYIECSAKYNWHILLLFSELLKSVGCARCKHVHTTIRFQGALRRNRCTIM